MWPLERSFHERGGAFSIATGRGGRKRKGGYVEPNEKEERNGKKEKHGWHGGESGERDVAENATFFPPGKRKRRGGKKEKGEKVNSTYHHISGWGGKKIWKHVTTRCCMMFEGIPRRERL